MHAKRMAYIETMMDAASDFSDGAFWDFMQEKGIDAEEVFEVFEWRVAAKLATASEDHDALP